MKVARFTVAVAIALLAANALPSLAQVEGEHYQMIANHQVAAIQELSLIHI